MRIHIQPKYYIQLDLIGGVTVPINLDTPNLPKRLRKVLGNLDKKPDNWVVKVKNSSIDKKQYPALWTSGLVNTVYIIKGQFKLNATCHNEYITDNFCIIEMPNARSPLLLSTINKKNPFNFVITRSKIFKQDLETKQTTEIIPNVIL